MPKSGWLMDIRQLIKEEEPIIWVNWKALPKTYDENVSIHNKAVKHIETIFYESGYRSIQVNPLVSVYVRIHFVNTAGDYSMFSLPVRSGNSFIAFGRKNSEVDSRNGLLLLSWDIGLNRNNMDYLDTEKAKSLSQPDHIRQMI